MALRMEERIFAILKANAGVYALLSTSPDTGIRVWPVTAQQGGPTAGQSLEGNPAPYVVYEVIGRESFPIQENPAGGLRKWTIRFNSFGGYSDARSVADALAAALVGFHDSVLGINGCFRVSESDLWDDYEKFVGIEMDLVIWENLP